MANGTQWKVEIKFTPSVAKQFQNKLSKDIVNAIEGSPQMRKEIARVFQMANRRIQNVESAGLFSPAIAALGKGDIKGYSKFSVKGFGNTGSDWQSLKKEYAKAVSFLNQPTSSASGARQFEAQVKQQMGVDEKLWSGIRDSILGGYNSVSSDLLLALPYSDFMQEVYSRAADSSSSQMEQDAIDTANGMEEAIKKEADRVAQETTEHLEDWMKRLANGFKIDF